MKKREGAYFVSPWALTWDDENYYMIAYDMGAGKIKHFRVDKMRAIRIEDRKRAGREMFKNFNLKRGKYCYGFGNYNTRSNYMFFNTPLFRNVLAKIK